MYIFGSHFTETVGKSDHRYWMEVSRSSKGLGELWWECKKVQRKNVTCKSLTCNSIEPKPSTIAIWASVISTFMYCNYFITSYLSHFIHTYLGILLAIGLGLQKTLLGALPSDSALSHRFLWTVINFSDAIFSSWCYGIPMLNFSGAFLYTWPGRASFPFSITAFCFHLFGLIFTFFSFWHCR